MRPRDFFDFVPLDRTRLRLTTVLDGLLGAGSLAVLGGWLTGHPLLYSADAPVMSPFTALSILLLAGTRQARLHLETWPVVLSLAMTGLVLGGNASSIVRAGELASRLRAPARAPLRDPRLVETCGEASPSIARVES